LASSLAGAATGFGEGAGAGIAAGEHILTSPYRAALQDYDIRTKGLESAANVEAAQVSDYLKNLEMATKYGFDRDKLGMEQFFKGIESEQAGRKLEIEAAKAEADRQQALGQIKRWLAQTRNEDEKNDLDRLRIGIEQGNQASLAEYRRITGQAAQTTAGAAVTRAEAAKQTADKYQPYSAARTPTVQEQGRARNLVLEEMMTEPRYKKFIEVNTDAYGPSFVITEEGSLNEGLRAEINRRVNEKLRQSYTGFGGNTPIADEADEPDPDDYGDFELGPLSVGPGR
jgi:hypothetical protein